MRSQGTALNTGGNLYWRVLTTYLRPQRLKVLLLGALLLGGVGLQIVIPQVTRTFIDQALAGGPIQQLIRLALVFLGAATVKYLISLGTTYVSEDVGWTATNAMRSDLAAHCLELDMSFHNRHTPGELIERIDGDIKTLSNFFSQMFIRTLSNLLLMIGILTVLFLEDWRLGLAFFGFAMVVLLILGSMRGIATEDFQAKRQASAGLFGFIEERLSGTEDVRSSGANSYTLRRLFMLMYDLWHKDLVAWRKVARLRTITFALFSFGSVLALLLGSMLFRSGGITIGTVYLIYAYVQILSGPVERLALDAQDFQQANASLLRVIELFRTRTRIADPVHGTDLPPGALSVEVRNLSFSYAHAFAGRGQVIVVEDESAPGLDQPEPVPELALDTISFRLEPGEKLGLLGRTGSGKTTIARLLLRLYDPSAGAIYLNGQDIRSIRLNSLRQRAGVVTQDVQLFQTSVRDNLTLFDRSVADDQIIDVIEELGLGSWYRSLKDGLNTELASKGGGLSAGQAQLLAFARVFLRDPGLVILDEASSRLDPATERLIERAIRRLLQGRTAIIIAHRLATIERVDKVLLLSNGHILEHGQRALLVNDVNSHFSKLLERGLHEELV
jgi:ATP-binding cassette, subfamily B, bacterial